MRAAVLLNGEPYEGEIKADRVYCADGAYNWARGKVKIDVNLGDFDSAEGEVFPRPDKIYPAEKDFTDGELTVARAIADGADEILIYGGFGGRSDHFIGNLHLLFKAEEANIPAAMLSDSEIAWVKRGKIDFSGYEGATVSVLPFGDELHIIESAGLRYSYPERLCRGQSRGISNVVEKSGAFLRVEGWALVIIERGKL